MNLSESYKKRIQNLAGIQESMEYKINTKFNPIPQQFEKRFSRSNNSATFTDKDGQEFFIIYDNNGHALIKVYKFDAGFIPVAHLFLFHDDKTNTYTPNAGNADAVFVEPAYRNKGIARAMYEFAQHSGLNVVPADVQAPEIKSFWDSREKLEEVERELGKKLSDTQGKQKVWVYRAVGPGVTTFNDRDYVTLSKKFAIDHAESNHIYNEEQQQVIKALISTENLYDATNPGEYFYSGPEVQGKVYYITKGLDYEGFEELGSQDFLREDFDSSNKAETEFNKYGDLQIKDMHLIYDGQDIGDAHINFMKPSSGDQTYLYLNSIRLLNYPKGQGIGTKFMQQLFKMADANGYTIVLTPSDINRSKLERWYKSLGFILNKGKNKDFLHRELMYRIPK